MVWDRGTYSFFCMWIPGCTSTFVEKMIISLWVVLGTLSKINRLQMYMFISILSVLFHWSVCLSWCQLYPDFIYLFIYLWTLTIKSQVSWISKYPQGQCSLACGNSPYLCRFRIYPGIWPGSSSLSSQFSSAFKMMFSLFIQHLFIYLFIYCWVGS